MGLADVRNYSYLSFAGSWVVKDKIGKATIVHHVRELGPSPAVMGTY